MSLKVNNPTKEAIKIDNITLNPVFQLVNKDVKIKAEVTILSSDFSTYVGELQPEEEAEFVLLFEVSNDKKDEMSGATLKVITKK